MGSRRRTLAIVAISFGTALVVLDSMVVTVALPTIARALAVPESAAVKIVTVYQLVLVMTLLPLSALGDRLGLRTVYVGGQMVFAVGALLCLLADSLWFLLVARAVQALGTSATLAVSAALVRAIYPPEQLGRGIGINGVIVSSAAALSPAVGAAVLSFAPWPWVFVSALPFACLSLLLARALPASIPRRRPYDSIAALLCALMFGLIVGGIDSAAHGTPPATSLAVVVTGFAVALVFVRRQRSAEDPVFPVDLLAQPLLSLSIVAAMAAFAGSMITIVSLPFRLEAGFGFSPAEIGAMILPWPLTMMVVAPLAGQLSDRIPAGLLGGLGMTIAAAAFLLLSTLPADPNWADIAWRMVLGAVGYGLFTAPNARLILSSVPRARTASAGGLIATARLVGQTLGATVVTLLLSLSMGAGPWAPRIAMGFALLAGLCSLARLRLPRGDRPHEREEPIAIQ